MENRNCKGIGKSHWCKISNNTAQEEEERGNRGNIHNFCVQKNPKYFRILLYFVPFPFL